MTDGPKAEPSLASWFAEMYCHDTDRMPDEIAYHERILAALRAVETAQARIDFEADRCERLMDENERLERAVEAVRAYRPKLDDSDASYVEGYRDGVRLSPGLVHEDCAAMSASDDTTSIDNAYCAIAVASLREWLRDAFVAGQNADPLGSEVYADLAIRSYLDPERKL